MDEKMNKDMNYLFLLEKGNGQIAIQKYKTNGYFSIIINNLLNLEKTFNKYYKSRPIIVKGSHSHSQTDGHHLLPHPPQNQSQSQSH